MKSRLTLEGRIRVEAFMPVVDHFGEKILVPLWKQEFKPNNYPSEGLDYVLEVIFKNGTRNDPLYVLLSGTDATDPASWTMANQGSTWTEITAYSEASRQEFVDGSISGHKINNSASQAEFNITGTVTVYGAGLSTDSTKGGTSGKLLCIGNFEEGSKSLDNGAVLKVTYEVGAQNTS